MEAEVNQRSNDYVVEFLTLDWPTYGLADLQHAVDGATPEDTARRVELLSAALSRSGTKAAKQEAIALLTSWLQRPESHGVESWRRLQLRLALYCHSLRTGPGYVQALGHVETLIADNPQSVAILALKGNVLGHLGRWSEAMDVFDAVIARRPEWVEPQLERIEILVAQGEWTRAASDAEGLFEDTRLNARERVIAGALLAVGRAAVDPRYGPSAECASLRSQIDGTKVPDDVREEWRFGTIRQALAKVPALSPALNQELSEWLLQVETMIRPVS